MSISDLLNIVIQIDFPSRKLAHNAHDDYRYWANTGWKSFEGHGFARTEFIMSFSDYVYKYNITLVTLSDSVFLAKHFIRDVYIYRLVKYFLFIKIYKHCRLTVLKYLHDGATTGHCMMFNFYQRFISAARKFGF